MCTQSEVFLTNLVLGSLSGSTQRMDLESLAVKIKKMVPFPLTLGLTPAGSLPFPLFFFFSLPVLARAGLHHNL